MREWLRGYIEQIILDGISEDAYSQLGPAELSEISMQVTLFVTNIVLSILGTLLLAIVAWILVNRHQTRTASLTLEIERQNLLRELEETHSRLSSTRCVRFPNHPRFDPNVEYAFVVALTRDVHWTPFGRIRYEWGSGDRDLVFTADGALISSTELHNFLYWFRRVHRARRASLLHRSDLYDIWRQVLPFVTDARYSFLVEYFGGTTGQGEEDVAAIREVATEILHYCRKHDRKVPVGYLSGRIDPLLHRSLPPELAALVEPGEEMARPAA